MEEKRELKARLSRNLIKLFSCVKKKIKITSDPTQKEDTSEIITFDLTQTNEEFKKKLTSESNKLKKDAGNSLNNQDDGYPLTAAGRGNSIFTKVVETKVKYTQTNLPTLLIGKEISYLRPIMPKREEPLVILDKVFLDESVKVEQIRKLALNGTILINKRTFVGILTEKGKVVNNLVSQIMDVGQEEEMRRESGGLAEKDLAVSDVMGKGSFEGDAYLK